MNSLVYQNWYLNKKSQDATLLYEKLKRVAIKKEMLDEADQDMEDVEVDVGQMARQYASKMGLSNNKNFVSEVEKTLNRTLDNYDPKAGGFVMSNEEVQPLVNSLIKAKIGLMENKTYNNLKNKVKDKEKLKQLIKEESQKHLLNERGSILGSFITGSLSFLGKFIRDYGLPIITTYTVGKLILQAGDQLGQPAIATAANLLKPIHDRSEEIGQRLAGGLAGASTGIESGGQALGNLGQGLERLGSTALRGTQILATAAGAGRDRQLKMWCKKNTRRYDPQETYNVGDIFLATPSNDPSNVYVYLVTSVDQQDGSFDADPVLCKKPLPAS